MRILVATACLCIIAATSYFFWKEYREATAHERAARAQYEANERVGRAVYEEALKEVQRNAQGNSK